MSRFTRFLAFAAACLGLDARAGLYTDLWWNPRESGWGVNVVQQLETAFVTLFVYDPQGKPTWYYASDARIVAYVASGLPIFSGTLYRAEGPWHGGAFDPARVRPTAVGQVSLEVLAKDRMRVTYTAENVSVAREVVRQTWQEEILAAHYVGQFNLRQARPGQTPHGTRDYPGDVLLHLDQGQGYLRVDDNLQRRCEYRGAYTQSGKLLKLAGTFTCSFGDALEGTFELTDLESTQHGMSGYLRTSSAALNEYGPFAAVRR